MIVRMTDEVALRLMTTANSTRGKEFSGFGFCEKKEDEILVYDFVLLDIGSEVFTEIPTHLILPLMDRTDAANMKVWVHLHPVGDGKPGPHNWSGTDNKTISTEPLGGIPELVKWSVSIVLTPKGWVGRIDNHVTKKTKHIGVVPQADVYDNVNSVVESKSIRHLAREAAQQFSEEEMDDLGMTLQEMEEFIRDGLRDGSLTMTQLDDLYYDDEYFGDDEWTEQGRWDYTTPVKARRRL